MNWNAFMLSDLCVTLWERTRDNISPQYKAYTDTKANYAFIAKDCPDTVQALKDELDKHESLAADAIMKKLENL